MGSVSKVPRVFSWTAAGGARWAETTEAALRPLRENWSWARLERADCLPNGVRFQIKMTTKLVAKFDPRSKFNRCVCMGPLDLETQVVESFQR